MIEFVECFDPSPADARLAAEMGRVAQITEENLMEIKLLLAEYGVDLAQAVVGLWVLVLDGSVTVGSSPEELGVSIKAEQEHPYLPERFHGKGLWPVAPSVDTGLVDVLVAGPGMVGDREYYDGTAYNQAGVFLGTYADMPNVELTVPVALFRMRVLKTPKKTAAQ